MVAGRPIARHFDDGFTVEVTRLSTTPNSVPEASRLSARFVEWLMGIPDGWVTDIDLPRIAQMRVIGIGVFQQAAVAIRHLDEVLRRELAVSSAKARQIATRLREEQAVSV